MEERDEKRVGYGCFLAYASLFLSAPILYVLSIGPAHWFAKKWPVTDDFLRICYLPLTAIGNHFTPFRWFLDWYMNLWWP